MSCNECVVDLSGVAFNPKVSFCLYIDDSKKVDDVVVFSGARIVKLALPQAVKPGKLPPLTCINGHVYFCC